MIYEQDEILSFVKFHGSEIDIIFSPEIRIAKKVSYVSDCKISNWHFPSQLFVYKERRWHRHPRWRRNTIPIVVLAADRGNKKRNAILKYIYRHPEHTIILLFQGAGQEKNSVCRDDIYISLALHCNVIAFTFSHELSKEQMAVFNHLLTHWGQVARKGSAVNYLKQASPIKVSDF